MTLPPPLATCILSFYNCLDKLCASLYRQLVYIYVLYFLVENLATTLHVVSTIIK